MNPGEWADAELCKTLSQFGSGSCHDADFEAFRAFRASTVRVILDVGANRGQAVASLRLAFPDAVIHAFEANPSFFGVLSALVDRLPGTLHVHHHGLGCEEGRLRFFVPWVGDQPFLEESSTRRDYFDKPWVVDKYRQRGAIRLEESFVDVRAGDSLGLAPDLVKVDVEGAEYDFLVGLQHTLLAHRPHLLVENSDWGNVTPMLADLGYLPFRWEAAERRFVPFHGTTVNTFYLHPHRITELPLTVLSS